MKQFFYLVFGGLLIVGAGLGISYGGAKGWQALSPYLEKSSLAAVAHAIIPQPLDGTSISGLVRSIRYSAHEEEDLINSLDPNNIEKLNAKVSALSYIVKNLTNGDVTIEHNSEKLLPVASLTKLVTAVVARRMIDADERITVSREIMSTYGNTAQFRVGETFKSQDLLYPLLMVSSNDAAEALAYDYGRQNFISAMNEFTQSIGAYRTYFQDPSGLSAENVSTASDMALILDWIKINDPEIIGITSLKTKTIRGHTWVNPTHFLSWAHYVGGKNGYTPEANRTASSLFTMGQNKDLYAVVVLGSEERDYDVMRLLRKVE